MSFVDFIKLVIRDYPEGSTILNELLQNADDAGATKVTFVLDSRPLHQKPFVENDRFKSLL